MGSIRRTPDIAQVNEPIQSERSQPFEDGETIWAEWRWTVAAAMGLAADPSRAQFPDSSFPVTSARAYCRRKTTRADSAEPSGISALLRGSGVPVGGIEAFSGVLVGVVVAQDRALPPLPRCEVGARGT